MSGFFLPGFPGGFAVWPVRRIWSFCHPVVPVGLAPPGFYGRVFRPDCPRGLRRSGCFAKPLCPAGGQGFTTGLSPGKGAGASRARSANVRGPAGKVPDARGVRLFPVRRAFAFQLGTGEPEGRSDPLSRASDAFGRGSVIAFPYLFHNTGTRKEEQEGKRGARVEKDGFAPIHGRERADERLSQALRKRTVCVAWSVSGPQVERVRKNRGESASPAERACRCHTQMCGFHAAGALLRKVLRRGKKGFPYSSSMVQSRGKWASLARIVTRWTLVAATSFT